MKWIGCMLAIVVGVALTATWAQASRPVAFYRAGNATTFIQIAVVEHESATLTIVYFLFGNNQLRKRQFEMRYEGKSGRYLVTKPEHCGKVVGISLRKSTAVLTSDLGSFLFSRAQSDGVERAVSFYGKLAALQRGQTTGGGMKMVPPLAELCHHRASPLLFYRLQPYTVTLAKRGQAFDVYFFSETSSARRAVYVRMEDGRPIALKRDPAHESRTEAIVLLPGIVAGEIIVARARAMASMPQTDCRYRRIADGAFDTYVRVLPGSTTVAFVPLARSGHPAPKAMCLGNCDGRIVYDVAVLGGKVAVHQVKIM